MLELDPLSSPTLLGGTRHPVWSIDNWLAVYDDDSQSYLIHSFPQKDPILVSNQTGEPGTWLANGKGFIAAEIISNAASHLIHYDLSTNPPAVSDLQAGDGNENNNPVISPDGTLIAFAHRYLDAARWTRGRQFWVMDVDGSKPRAITDDGEFHHTSFAWHPDSQHVALVRFNESVLSEPPEIWLYNLEGAGFRVVINAYAPQWIP